MRAPRSSASSGTAAVESSLGERREQNLKLTLREVELALEGHHRRTDILENFHAKGSIRPTVDGGWTPVEQASY